ncbi:MAG: hypothetical protein R3346_01290, partial [Candidatus Spechtbacterales bacterium]|nr:hypothetical protein [Candidatus Spechtbacterales bacterium]
NAELIKKLETIFRELGFVEDAELKRLRQEVAEVPGEQYDAWRSGAERAVEGNEDRMRAQIGLLVAEANIYSSIGNSTAFRESINDAIEYAFQMGFDDVVEKLEQI